MRANTRRRNCSRVSPKSLVNGYGTDQEATWLLDNFRFHLVLQANPDGREKAETGLSWRKNVDNSNGACARRTSASTSIAISPTSGTPLLADPAATPAPAPIAVHGACPRPKRRTCMRYVAGTPDSSGVYRGGVFHAPVAPSPVTLQNGLTMSRRRRR